MEKINFCPSCGRKIEEPSNFCPECGKVLSEKKSSSFSFSKLGGSVSEIVDKTVSKVSTTTRNIKKNIDEKEEASRKTVNVTSLRYKEDAPERMIGAFYVGWGTGLAAKLVCIHFTNKALLVYVPQRKSFIQRLFSKNEELILDCKIDIKDIQKISRIQSPLTKLFSYEIITAKETYSMRVNAEPYTFSLYLSKILNFDNSIFNIDLTTGEHVKYVTATIVESGGGKNYGTLYITNKRVVFTKIASSSIALKADRLTTEEGTEMVFSIDIAHLKDIASEKKGVTNCEYHIKDEHGHYVIKFPQVVPSAFWTLIPDATGNKDLLERKKEVTKGLKVVLLVASFLGLAGEAEAGEVNVDSNEYDLDGDGDIDSIAYDSDGDGQMDTFAIDSNGDGEMDYFACDSNADGVVDEVAYDSNGDGVVDTVEMDTNGDGFMDAKGMDTDGDGAFDTIGKDANGDGVIDTFGADMDGDGRLDTFSVDTNNDGILDTTGVDVNHDGRIDKVAFDTNGDGQFDAIKMDTNNDGILDTTGVDVNHDGRIDSVYRGVNNG